MDCRKRFKLSLGSRRRWEKENHDPNILYEFSMKKKKAREKKNDRKEWRKRKLVFLVRK